MQAARSRLCTKVASGPCRLVLPGAAWTNSLLTGSRLRLDLSSRAARVSSSVAAGSLPSVSFTGSVCVSLPAEGERCAVWELALSGCNERSM